MQQLHVPQKRSVHPSERTTARDLRQPPPLLPVSFRAFEDSPRACVPTPSSRVKVIVVAVCGSSSSWAAVAPRAHLHVFSGKPQRPKRPSSPPGLASISSFWVAV
eukprot:SAG31_NODE_6141_length_2152_cov_1.026790_1_plen_105_part_00